MTTPGIPIEKIPVQAFRYQAKCPRCRRVIKGPSEKLTEKNIVEHIATHDREEEEGRKWYEKYKSKLEA